MTMKTCNNCQCLNEDGTNFCGSCGNNLNTDNNRFVQQALNNQQQARNNTNSTFSGTLLALIVFFVVLPLGSCMVCTMCAGVGATHSLINSSDTNTRSEGEYCSTDLQCKGSMLCKNNKCGY